GELTAGPHHDALDLIAVAAIETLIPAPGAIDAIMLERKLAVIALEIVQHPLDRLGMVLGGDQHGIVHRHHHEIFDPHQSDTSMIAVSEAVACTLENDLALALNHVAWRVLLHKVPQRGPRADIVPRRFERYAAHRVA